MALYLLLTVLFANVMVDGASVIYCANHTFTKEVKGVKPYTLGFGESVTIICDNPNKVYSVQFGQYYRWQALWMSGHYYDDDMYDVQTDDSTFQFTIKFLDATDTGNYIVKWSGTEQISFISINVVLRHIPIANYTEVIYEPYNEILLECSDVVIVNSDTGKLDSSYSYYWKFIDEKTGNQSLYENHFDKRLLLTNNTFKGLGWYACSVFNYNSFFGGNNTNQLPGIYHLVLPFVSLFRVTEICDWRNVNETYRITYHGLTPARYRGKISQAKISRVNRTTMMTIICFLLDLGIGIFIWLPFSVSDICMYLSDKFEID